MNFLTTNSIPYLAQNVCKAGDTGRVRAKADRAPAIYAGGDYWSGEAGNIFPAAKDDGNARRLIVPNNCRGGARPACTNLAPVAQWIERRTSNSVVARSNRAGRASLNRISQPPIPVHCVHDSGLRHGEMIEPRWPPAEDYPPRRCKASSTNSRSLPPRPGNSVAFGSRLFIRVD